MQVPGPKQVTEWMGALEPDLERLEGVMLDDGRMLQLVRRTASVVRPSEKLTALEQGAALRTLDGIKGRALDKGALAMNVTRLVANWHFIAEHMPVPDWDGSATDTDAVILGVGQVRAASAGRPRHLLALKLKTGLCAGIIQCASLTDEAIAAFLRRGSGTARYDCAVEEVSGMEARLSVSLEPRSGLLRILAWKATPAQKRHNCDLAERRQDVAKCRLAPAPCNTCTKTVKECPLAVWLPERKGN